MPSLIGIWYLVVGDKSACLLSAVASCIGDAEFIVEETPLKAIQGNQSSAGSVCYKAYGVVALKDDLELLLLETSGSYGNDNKPRYGFDHVKGAFGARTMLRSIIMHEVSLWWR